MIIYFIRHGQTVWNADGRIQGHLDTDLSPLGIQQAKVAARRMESVHIDAVYASDLKRAWQTAEIIAEPHNLPVHKTSLLREACLGLFQGLTMDEAQIQYPEAFKAYKADGIKNRPPQGETLEEVVSRSRTFLAELRAEREGQNVCVVGHGGTGRGIICAAFDLPVRSVYGRVHLDNTGLTIIDFSKDRPMLVTLNDTCHLCEEYAETIQEF